ncbi:Transcriptional regulator MraZ [Meiothermus luteus]|uniref:Transcriptional regulator MraZ n=1 Tax=Meiothermus luteus TaxID=2026184 RepID=A0A399ESE9_9DEIN|nr:division/cell wall cluster transcriptional repressor MraZ [Meiothermus luteus]RIH86430.1 Transcriptional regulator MraZ [Meiothermus luteus]RMH56544.1 MAG: transcriptional regulator MraZ [Deinococcota bacterium]
MPFGEYQYSLDEKGRVVIPPPFRSFIEDGVVITRGLEGCLYLYPLHTWSNIERQLQNVPLIDRPAQLLVRFLYSGAHKTQMDNASRITIPPTLRKFAGLEDSGEAVVVGAPTRLELWSEQRWWESINKFLENPTTPEALRGLIG